MRKVASYALESEIQEGADSSARFKALGDLVTQWINEKGARDPRTRLFVFSDGRSGTYSTKELLVDGTTLVDHTLYEQTQDGSIQSQVEIGLHGQKLLVYVEIRAGGPPNQVGPVMLDIRTPKIIRSILDDGSQWMLGSTPLTTKALPFQGYGDARRLIDIIWHKDRNLPLIVVSDDNEGPITPDFDERLAYDLSGLALVAHIDSAVAWAITNERGADWSCFNGAVRVYWPGLTAGSHALRHPLWTKYSLLRSSEDAHDAAHGIRGQLRRRILGLSAFAVNEPPLIGKIRTNYQDREARKRREQLKEAADWVELADGIEADNIALGDELAEKNAEIDDLKRQLSNLQKGLQWRDDTGAAEVEPEQEIQPRTVQEAVDRTRQECASTLFFGADVDEGISTLSSDAGPPEKILLYLRTLGEMGNAHAQSSLGVAQIQWLNDRNVHASGESETIRNSSAERSKRQWRGREKPQYFENHLKPSDAVSPDKCVRIYFDYEQETKMVIVGWIGRHPG